jgi:hypothetical protein
MCVTPPVSTPVLGNDTTEIRRAIGPADHAYRQTGPSTASVVEAVPERRSVSGYLRPKANSLLFAVPPRLVYPEPQ